MPATVAPSTGPPSGKPRLSLADIRASDYVRRWFDKAVRDANGCWLWAGTLNQKGYGMVQFLTPRRHNIRAHRVSWMLHRGEIPQGFFVCHACDVRRCVNPDHLFVGTAGDNNRDMFSKGRGRNPSRKSVGLNTRRVKEVRRLFQAEVTALLLRLGEQFGVGAEAIEDAVRRKTFRAWALPEEAA